MAIRGLLADVETIHLDRGYEIDRVREDCATRGLTDVVCAKRRVPGTAKQKVSISLGLRWAVEQTNSWLPNVGQLRQATDRTSAQGLTWLALAITLVITVKFVKWARRWEG